LLALLPVSHVVTGRALLRYDPAEAGGLMSPDFLLLRGSTSVGDAIEAVRTSRIEPALLTAVFGSPPERSPVGSTPVTALLRAERGLRLETLVKHEIPSLTPDTSFEEVARLMADYNLTAIPVADEHG